VQWVTAQNDAVLIPLPRFPDTLQCATVQFCEVAMPVPVFPEAIQ
jgi:hypothetical protein